MVSRGIAVAVALAGIAGCSHTSHVLVGEQRPAIDPPAPSRAAPDSARAPDPEVHDYIYGPSAGPMVPPGNLGARFGPNDNGLSVISVERSGPAATCGLRAGDLITAINGRPTAPIWWEHAVQLLVNSGPSVKLIVDGKGELTLTLPADAPGRSGHDRSDIGANDPP